MAAKRRARCGFCGSGVVDRSGDREESGRADRGLVGKRTAGRSNASSGHERNGRQTANGRAASAGGKTAAGDLQGGLFGIAGRNARAGAGDCSEDSEASVVDTELASRAKMWEEEKPETPSSPAGPGQARDGRYMESQNRHPERRRVRHPRRRERPKKAA